MTPATLLFRLSDHLQTLLPGAIALQDMGDSFSKKEYGRAALKTMMIFLIVQAQNLSTRALKKAIDRSRPLFLERVDAFPSSHMALAALPLFRLLFRDGLRPSLSLCFTVTGCLLVGAGRILSGMHDTIIDLAGGIGCGCLFASAWHMGVKGLE